MAKTVALGTTLTVGGTAVGNLTSIGVPSPDKPEIEVSDFDSVAAEFLVGLPDNGEMAVSGWFNYTDAGQAILLADAHDAAATSKVFVISFVRQAVKFTFSGWVKSYTPTAPGPNDAYGFDATIRVTGTVVPSAIT